MSFASAMPAHLADTMTKKIPLAIDAKPFAEAIDNSVRRTMTKNIMTKPTMTNTIMTNVAEILAVALVLLLGAAILSI